MTTEHFASTPLIRHGDVRPIPSLWLRKALSFQLPRLTIAQPAVSPPATQTFAERLAQAGVAIAMQATTSHPEFRGVGRMRVPHCYFMSSDVTGRTIFQVERFELAPDTCTLQPSSESRRK